jgi:DNA-directed RNA polymerase specialized sigma24 family protein
MSQGALVQRALPMADFDSSIRHPDLERAWKEFFAGLEDPQDRSLFRSTFHASHHVERQILGGFRTVQLVEGWLGQRPPKDVLQAGRTSEEAAATAEGPDPDTPPLRLRLVTASLDWPKRAMWQPWTVDRRYSAAHFEKYLDTLTAKQRDAIEAMYFTSMTQDDAATSLGLKRGGLRSRIEQGLASLRVVVPRPQDHGPRRVFQTEGRCRNKAGKVPEWCEGHFIQQRCAGHPECITVLPRHSNPWIVCAVYQAKGGHDLPMVEGATQRRGPFKGTASATVRP